MKTSSKIVAGFFILVFLVPLAMLLAFKSKIRNNEYKLMRNDSYQSVNSRQGNLGSFKVVKLVGYDGNLKVNLGISETPHYSYTVDGDDSVNVFHVADTVYIQATGEIKQSHSVVIGSGEEDRQNPNNYSRNDLWVELSLPSLENIVAQDAEVFLKTKDSSAVKLIAIDLKKNALLSIGQQNDHDRNRKMTPVQVGELKVTADDARLFIGKNVAVSQLDLNTNGISEVTISNGVAIDKLTGSLSDSSAVKANWKFLKQLQGISQP